MGVATRAAAAVFIIMGLLLTGAAPASAQDRALSQDFPLRLEDAFPTATGEGAARGSVRGVLPHRGADRVEAPVVLELGVAPRTQVSIGAGLSSEPHETRAGDVLVAGRYQFWVQEAVLPNLAAQLAVTAPTGVDSHAWTLEAKALATRAVSTTLFVHVNAALAVVDRLDDDARRLRYGLALGTSWIVPRWASLMLAADVYAAQAWRRQDTTTVGLEVGFRQRITAGLSWHGAVGTEVAGPAARAALTVTTGLSYGFSLPGR